MCLLTSESLSNTAISFVVAKTLCHPSVSRPSLLRGDSSLTRLLIRSIEAGENVIFFILEARYPDKDPIDRAGKALFDVFRPAKETGLRAVGWSAGSGVGTHWSQVRNRSECAPALWSYQSKISCGVCVWKCHRDEEEEEHDEEESSNDMDDVEKFLNEDDESDFVLKEDEVLEVLASAWKHKRHEISKEKLRRVFGRNRRQLLRRVSSARKCRNPVWLGTGQENVHRNCPVEKEAHFCDWSPKYEPRFLCFFESKHCSNLERIQKQNLAVVEKDPWFLFC